MVVPEEIDEKQLAAIRKAHSDSWRKLKKCFRGKGLSENDAGVTRSDFYERQLSGYKHRQHGGDHKVKYVSGLLEPILKAIVDAINQCMGEDFPLRIGRSIIHLNSYAAGQRIRIPLNGRAWKKGKRGETRWSDSKWRRWASSSLKGNDRTWMFLQPDHPTHLLTELMWRFQRKTQWGDGMALALFAENTTPLYNCCCNSDGLRVLYVPDNFVDTPESVSECGDVLSRMNDWREELGTDKDTGPEVPLPRKYNTQDVCNLFKSPLGKLATTRKKGHGPVATHIFYLPDTAETEYLGGIDFELWHEHSVEPPKDIDEDDLRAFFRNIQWIVSQHIIQLVSSVERNCFFVGETYKNNFFADNGCAALLKLLADRKKKAGSKGMLHDILEQIEFHFTLAGEERGRYWCGHSRYAFEVACRVADIFKIMFSGDDDGHCPSSAIDNLPDAVRRSGPHLAKLDELLHRQPFFVQQIFRCLQSERQLFHIPLYRDHFVHSFHAFVIGVLLLDIRPKEIIPETHKPTTRTLRSWFLVAMWHDVAYSLQKIDGLAEVTVRRLWGESHIKRHTGIMPLRPSLGHLHQIENISYPDLIEQVSTKAIALDVKGNTITERDILSAVGMDRTDHGIWSSIMLQHSLNADKRFKGKILRMLLTPAKRGSRRALKEKEIELLAAIVPHHINDWGVPGLADFYVSESEGHDSTCSATIPHENRLGRLLILADMLSQMGREAPEIAGAPSSDIGIKLKNIYVIKPGDEGAGSLVIALKYDSKIKTTTIEERYTKPVEVIDLGVCSKTKSCLQIIIDAPNQNKLIPTDVSLGRKRE